MRYPSMLQGPALDLAKIGADADAVVDSIRMATTAVQLGQDWRSALHRAATKACSAYRSVFAVVDGKSAVAGKDARALKATIATVEARLHQAKQAMRVFEDALAADKVEARGVPPFNGLARIVREVQRQIEISEAPGNSAHSVSEILDAAREQASCRVASPSVMRASA